MKKVAWMLGAVAAVVAAVCACAPSDPMVVRTKDGLVKGIEEDGTLAFLGIPYAKVERFMPPLPVDKWDTVMVCDHFGPMVMQGNGRREVPESVMSERNSCVLNVWTTDTKAHKPFLITYDAETKEWKQISLLPIMPGISYRVEF